MLATVRQEGQALNNNITVERCNTLVVDAINKDPNYIYSKRVWYVDPETAIILWTELYDSSGKFWKSFMNTTCPLPTEIGDVKSFIVGTMFQDFQRGHAGVSDQVKIQKPKITIDVPSDTFTVGNLQRTY